MTQQFHDLNFSRLTDGTIRLEQTGYAGEAAIIDAHPEQIRYIARTLAGLKPETAGEVADLKRRIAVLVDKLQDIVCGKAFRTDLIGECGDGFEYLAKLDGLLDLALEFDDGRLKPEEAPSAPEGSQTARSGTEPAITHPGATASGCMQLDLV